MIRFLVNVPEELHDTLRAIAGARGCTLTSLVRNILWDWVTKKLWGDDEP